ncbi:DUF883 family protein [Candidatus Aalborgicola defluviihabitans]|uniref:DUF883 family protein n=2 Tax=Candidatus Aalborgicola defluviihabitans TaxID=3386187 RepID=UPI001D7C1477|nr:DUF883 domain-containing protein [Burkholderiales bacterium]MBK7279277.1 DUF883 domain-containing protein [Burkholderiales bacterium]MBL0243838.1 DUF883 domain-containing protein [Rhodoferax sp.]
MSDSPTSSMGSQERLVNDIRAVIVDAEDMLLATADQSGDKIAQLRARIEARLKDARSRLASAEAILVERTRAAAQATDDYVHDNPWQAVSIGAGVGFLVGFILGRR